MNRRGFYPWSMWPALETLLPSAGLLFLLYLVLRHMMEGDRRERMAQAKWEQEHAVAPLPTEVNGTIDTGPTDSGVIEKSGSAGPTASDDS